MMHRKAAVISYSLYSPSVCRFSSRAPLPAAGALFGTPIGQSVDMPGGPMDRRGLGGAPDASPPRRYSRDVSPSGSDYGRGGGGGAAALGAMMPPPNLVSLQSYGHIT